MVNFQWLTSGNEVDQHIIDWQKCATLYLDTEFIREKTFVPILALLQLFDGNSCYLIEPAALKESQFQTLLANKAIRKVFHSGGEDCEVLYRFLDVVIENYWDTQIAEFFISGTQPGYANTVQMHLQKVIDKGESRSDWLQRPLSHAQEQYAANDVVYLPEVYHCQLQLLNKQKIDLKWVEADCALVATRVLSLDDYSLAYLDIKNAWQLNSEQLARLIVLSDWRERKARAQNIPKTFVLKNPQMFALAQLGLDKQQSLPFVQDWHPASRRRYGTEIQQLLSDGQCDSSEQLRLLRRENPLSPKFWQNYTEAMKAAGVIIEQVAAELDLAAEVLCSKKLLRNQVKYWLQKSQQSPVAWQGFRQSLLESKLKPLFQTS